MWGVLQRGFERLRSWQLGSNGGWALFVATIAVGISNFGFHMLMSRLLGPGTYGAFGSLLGLVTVLTVVVGALQVAVTQAVAERGPHGLKAVSASPTGELLLSASENSTNKVGKVDKLDRSVATSTYEQLALLRPLFLVGLVGVACVVVLGAASPLLEGFLHLSSAVPVVLFGFFVGLAVVSLVPQGVLLGRLSFRRVALAGILGAIARLLSGALLVEAGFGLDGAVAASVLNATVSLAVLLWPLRFELLPRRQGVRLEVHLRTLVLSVIAVSGSAAFVAVGPFLARHFLAASASGYFVAASTAAQISLFIPGAVAMVAFPRFAVLHGEGSEARRLLGQSLGAVGLLGGAAAVVLMALPHLVIAVLFGNDYQSAVPALRILAVGGFMAGLISLLVYFHLARRSLASALCWPGAALMVVLIAIFHSGLDPIAWMVLLATTAVLVAMGMAVFGAPTTTAGKEFASGELWAMGQPECELTVVVPYYNPGDRLRSTVESLLDTLSSSGVSFEVIAVSDGSTDGSEASIEGLAPETLRSVHLLANQGKGEALRVGLAMGKGLYLGFIDADGDLPPTEVASFVQLMRSYQPDIVLGSKRHPMSEVHYPPLRRLYSFGYQMLVRALFHLSVRDSQTGLKLIRREVLADVLPRMVEKRFAFDVELLVVARHLGYRRFFEAPIRILERFGSTISLSSVWGMLVDTLGIFYRLKVLRWYDRIPVVLGPFESGDNQIAVLGALVLGDDIRT